MVMNAGDTYRLQALLELAAAYPRPLTVRAVAGRRNVPGPFLARLLRSLAQGGLVSTTRGPSGGVRLARPPGEVTLAAVLPSLERPTVKNAGAAIAHVRDRLDSARREVLDSLTLAALREIERSTAGSNNWQI